jgi:hypothetical protein
MREQPKGRVDCVVELASSDVCPPPDGSGIKNALSIEVKERLVPDGP